MNTLLACVVIVAVFGQILCDYEIHKGNCNGQKKLLHEQKVEKDYKFLASVGETVEYCGENIRCVDVWNLWGDGTGGDATILYGGPDNHCVRINLKSQNSRGMAFKVEVWGY